MPRRCFSYNLRYPGQYYDSETGLFQNYFRDFDPAVGRYVESDPIGLKGGSSSTYAYRSPASIRWDSRSAPRTARYTGPILFVHKLLLEEMFAGVRLRG